LVTEKPHLRAYYKDLATADGKRQINIVVHFLFAHAEKAGQESDGKESAERGKGIGKDSDAF
jgi:hypothetical protein